MVTVEQVGPYTYEIAPREGMRVPGRIYADPSLFEQAGHEEALQQVANVATLPGIVEASIAMPDIHWGYGFPIGGVAAMDESDGVISPGGVGFDINCGVRLVRTDLRGRGRPAAGRGPDARADARASRRAPARAAPLRLAEGELRAARWRRARRSSLKRGLATPDDLEHTEEGGRMPGADPAAVSQQGAWSAAATRCGTPRLRQPLPGAAGRRRDLRRARRRGPSASPPAR